MHDQDVMLGAESHDPLEEFQRRSLSRRHVGIVDEHHLHTVQSGLLDRLEIGQEVRLLVQRVGDHFAAGEFYRSAVSGVAGIGYEHLVALVEEGHADVHQALFRTDQGVDLRLPVEIHAIELLVPVSESLAQDGFTLIRHVFVHVGTLRLFGETVDDRLVRGQVGAAHSEFHDLTARCRFDFGDLAQTARKIVLSDAVQPMGTGDVDCFCHSIRVFGFLPAAKIGIPIKI